MSSPDSNLVNRLAESLDRSSPPEASHRGNEVPSSTETHRARILRIDQDEARLAAQGCTWYEIKASTLRESDISYIKDKAGITSLYEVVIPHVHARAHCPPPGFLTFYVNQIDRGLRFPIPKFISSLCNHIGVPLSTYTLMQIITVKRLGPGKFYLSNRKQFRFIGGNPSSHKDDRMNKAEMLEALKERKSKSGGASSSHPPSKEKRQAPSEKERRKKHRHEEKGAGSTQESIPEVTISEPVDPTTKDPEQQSTEAPYTLLDASTLSFVSNPSGPASLDFIRHLVPDQDFDQLKKASDLGVFETVGLHFMQSLAWFGEAANRFSKVRAEVIKTKRSMDGMLGRHEALMKQLEEIQTKENMEKESLSSLAWFGEAANRFSKVRAEVIKTKRSMDGMLGRHEALMKQLEEIQTKENVEKESLSAELESARAEVQTLKAQMQYLEAQAQRSEEESKLHLAEVEKLQEEKANSWALEKEKFLKSKDFYSLCLKKAVMYFDKGFDECLAQFRANGYSEEEHPASFLDVEQALVDMPEDPEEGSLNRDGNTPPPQLDVILIAL
ncbi:hypothetical protein F511_34803 [Dorcoceras hygrometricum]|uniref:Uncharacterized protein n=1 Tax=Dorcoceras hygrometricum TaxID=472368 RepID=A0A2Z7C4E1_9LAMI|nr:hypothetical protein F511_34803 [Dorcoceras hygrometricum]